MWQQDQGALKELKRTSLHNFLKGIWFPLTKQSKAALAWSPLIFTLFLSERGCSTGTMVLMRSGTQAP